MVADHFSTGNYNACCNENDDNNNNNNNNSWCKNINNKNNNNKNNNNNNNCAQQDREELKLSYNKHGDLLEDEQTKEPCHPSKDDVMWKVFVTELEEGAHCFFFFIFILIIFFHFNFFLNTFNSYLFSYINNFLIVLLPKTISLPLNLHLLPLTTIFISSYFSFTLFHKTFLPSPQGYYREDLDKRPTLQLKPALAFLCSKDGTRDLGRMGEEEKKWFDGLMDRMASKILSSNIDMFSIFRNFDKLVCVWVLRRG